MTEKTQSRQGRKKRVSFAEVNRGGPFVPCAGLRLARLLPLIPALKRWAIVT
jgi:hypothetical protein